eukprot:6652695-Prymnesium_polylepis.1
MLVSLRAAKAESGAGAPRGAAHTDHMVPPRVLSHPCAMHAERVMTRSGSTSWSRSAVNRRLITGSPHTSDERMGFGIGRGVHPKGCSQ